MSAPVRQSSRARTMAGAACYVVATIQYAIAQVVTAAAWSPSYDWRHNYISDLGNTACGMFALPHATPMCVCSPLRALMNASFVVSGLLIIVGTALLWRFWPAARLMTAALVLWEIAGVGKLLVGLAPENTNLPLHSAAALNIPVGNVAIFLFSVAILKRRRRLAHAGIWVFLLGSLGTVLSIAGAIGGPTFLLGLGVGGMERLAGYPANIWLVAVGTVVLVESMKTNVPRITS